MLSPLRGCLGFGSKNRANLMSVRQGAYPMSCDSPRTRIGHSNYVPANAAMRVLAGTWPECDRPDPVFRPRLPAFGDHSPYRFCRSAPSVPISHFFPKYFYWCILELCRHPNRWIDYAPLWCNSVTEILSADVFARLIGYAEIISTMLLF